MSRKKELDGVFFDEAFGIPNVRKVTDRHVEEMLSHAEGNGDVVSVPSRNGGPSVVLYELKDSDQPIMLHMGTSRYHYSDKENGIFRPGDFLVREANGDVHPYTRAEMRDRFPDVYLRSFHDIRNVRGEGMENQTLKGFFENHREDGLGLSGWRMVRSGGEDGMFLRDSVMMRIPTGEGVLSYSMHGEPGDVVVVSGVSLRNGRLEPLESELTVKVFSLDDLENVYGRNAVPADWRGSGRGAEKLQEAAESVDIDGRHLIYEVDAESNLGDRERLDEFALPPGRRLVHDDLSSGRFYEFRDEESGRLLQTVHCFEQDGLTCVAGINSIGEEVMFAKTYGRMSKGDERRLLKKEMESLFPGRTRFSETTAREFGGQMLTHMYTHGGSEGRKVYLSTEKESKGREVESNPRSLTLKGRDGEFTVNIDKNSTELRCLTYRNASGPVMDFFIPFTDNAGNKGVLNGHMENGRLALQSLMDTTVSKCVSDVARAMTRYQDFKDSDHVDDPGKMRSAVLECVRAKNISALKGPVTLVSIGLNEWRNVPVELNMGSQSKSMTDKQKSFVLKSGKSSDHEISK